MIYHFNAHTIDCVCHSIRSMFRVLGIYNFGPCYNFEQNQWYKIFCRMYGLTVMQTISSSTNITNIDKIKKNNHFWTQIENPGHSVMEYTCKCLQAHSNAVKT